MISDEELSDSESEDKNSHCHMICDEDLSGDANTYSGMIGDQDLSEAATRHWYIGTWYVTDITPTRSPRMQIARTSWHLMKIFGMIHMISVGHPVRPPGSGLTQTLREIPPMTAVQDMSPPLTKVNHGSNA
jgi:hypothetical protein